jgi:hypothetical protein
VTDNCYRAIPFRDSDGRAKCQVCGRLVVAIPAGWIHTSESLVPVPVQGKSDSKVAANGDQAQEAYEILIARALAVGGDRATHDPIGGERP